MNSRGKAAEIIYKWLKTGDFPDRMIGSGPDRAFIMEVVYGVCRWQRSLEWIIGKCASRNPDKDIMAYLLIGVYQLVRMENVEEYAAINETVEAVKKSRAAHAVGFVNGVLRGIQRESDSLKKDLEASSLGVRESHPDELVSRWTESLGADKARELCQWNNSRPGIDLRLNLKKTSLAEFRERLKEKNIDAVPHPFAPDAFLSISHGTRVNDIPGFDDGLFYVQDPSTTVAVDLLDPQPGDNVLDACAAPGGKAMYICERMNSEGQIIAMDLHGDRLEPFLENVQRMDLYIISVIIGDARSRRDLELTCQNNLFDRILLDVPCSNTGVLRRRPDARWRFRPDRLDNLVRCQRAILTNCAKFLKPGGTMVYSTCSLEPEEDEQLIDAWLKDHPEFELKDSRKLFPPETQTDGAYAAALKKLI